jgi:predicted DNA-binding transcriptional regulator AlpA
MTKPTGPIADWWAGLGWVKRERIADTRDVAAMLGVSRQRVGQLVKDDPTFPRPFTVISGGRIWHIAGVQLWIAGHRPKVAPAAAGPFGQEAATLLRSAEALALECQHGHVGNHHVWLVLARAEPGSLIHRTLATMGVDAAEFERAATFMFGSLADRPRSTARMNPHVQELFAAAARRATEAGREVSVLDVAIGFIDKDERYRGRRRDPFLSYLERRGLEIVELRRRLAAVAADPDALATFEQRSLTRRRPRRHSRRRDPRLDLAPNPLGHDPWELSWGTVFGVRKDGRGLVIDGEQWFFRIDGDGFFMRTRDGHPVGYRYRVDPPPRRSRGNPRPVNGFLEVLPMPPPDVDRWPDHRYGDD